MWFSDMGHIVERESGIGRIVAPMNHELVLPLISLSVNYVVRYCYQCVEQSEEVLSQTIQKTCPFLIFISWKRTKR